MMSLRIRAARSDKSLSAFCITKDVKFLHADNEDSDQTVRMRTLIRVFVGRTCQKVRFLRLRLKCIRTRKHLEEAQSVPLCGGRDRRFLKSRSPTLLLVLLVHSIFGIHYKREVHGHVLSEIVHNKTSMTRTHNSRSLKCSNHCSLTLITSNS